MVLGIYWGLRIQSSETRRDHCTWPCSPCWQCDLAPMCNLRNVKPALTFNPPLPTQAFRESASQMSPLYVHFAFLPTEATHPVPEPSALLICRLGTEQIFENNWALLGCKELMKEMEPRAHRCHPGPLDSSDILNAHGPLLQQCPLLLPGNQTAPCLKGWVGWLRAFLNGDSISLPRGPWGGEFVAAFLGKLLGSSIPQQLADEATDIST